MIRIVVALTLAGIAASAVAGASEWTVIESRWRPDANSYAQKQVWEGYRWTEGWQYEEQFYPKMFAPAGSLHVIIRNISDKPQTITLSAIDGAALDNVITTPTRAGRVIWATLDTPQLPVKEASGQRQTTKSRLVPPGEWATCTIRLRNVSKRPVKLTFKTDSGNVDTPITIAQPKARIEYIGFSSKIDKVYCYVRGLDGVQRTGSVVIDGREVPAQWTAGPKGSGVTLATISPYAPLQYGTYHLVEVQLKDAKLAQGVKAWDCYFSTGLYGDATKEAVAEAKKRSFNTYYWRKYEEVLAAGLNHVPAYFYGTEPDRTLDKNGVLFNYNSDEPDCDDWSAGSELPVKDRLGVNGENKVIPLAEVMRQTDPKVPSLVLMDGTFKPLNWYVYGQIADVSGSDPYQLLGLGQLDYVGRVMQIVQDASTPRPTIAVLWAQGFVYKDIPPNLFPKVEGGDPKVRPPLPEEERMMAFYALGAGAKGLAYFCDYPDSANVTEDGSELHLSKNLPLFDEVGRINADALALGPYLGIGCPLPVKLENDQVWAKEIMSGPDSVVVIVVNKGHYVNYFTKQIVADHTPARNVSLSVPLPEGFGDCSVSEVKNGALTPSDAAAAASILKLSLDTVDTARAFVITRR